MSVKSLVDLAFDRIVGKVEPLTRFDRSSLERRSGQSRVASGTASWLYAVRISSEGSEGTGRLPAHFERVSDSVQLGEIAKRSLDDGYADLERRFHSWLGTNEQTDRALTAADCFQGPKLFGWERSCPDCLAMGWLKCVPCDGRGFMVCTPCNGRGQKPCSACVSLVGGKILGITGPTGRETCSGCGGLKFQLSLRTLSDYPNISLKPEDGRPCPTCNGSGYKPCRVCQGAKVIRCKDCRGQGRNPHGDCDGTGKKPCLNCDQKGYLHGLRRVECVVSDRFGIQLSDGNREVVRELTTRDLPALRSLARVSRRPATLGGDFVERHYAFDCAITEIAIAVGGQQLGIVAYGDEAHVADFKDAVKHLLAGDLAALKQAVASTRLRPWGHTDGLFDAVRRFLESEVNVRLEDTAFVRDRIIDSEYVAEAETLLRRALRRIFAARMGLAVLASALVPAIVFVVGHLFGWWTVLSYWTGPVLAGAVVPPLWLLERRTRSRLIAAFDAQEENRLKELGKKADGLLLRYRVIWSIRLAAVLVAAAVVGVLAVGLVNILPAVSSPAEPKVSSPTSTAPYAERP